jgi:hypothetical protein
VEELNAIGVFPFREENYNQKYYSSTGYTDTVKNGEIIRTHTVSNRYTVPQLKTNLAKRVRDSAKSSWKLIKEERDYQVEIDSENIDPALGQWVIDVQIAIQTIKDEVAALSSYEEGIEYMERGWHRHMPISPLDDNDS